MSKSLLSVIGNMSYPFACHREHVDKLELNQIACAMACERYLKSDFFLAMKNSGRVHLDRVSFNHHKKQFLLEATQTLFSCVDYHHTNSIASNSIYILSMLLRKAGNIVIATDLKEVLCLLKFLISSMKRPLFTT